MSPTETAMLNRALIVTLVLGFGIVAWLLYLILKKAPGKNVADEIREATQELGDGIKQYTQANIVLVLMEKFHDRPELLANLGNYSGQLMAAAIITRMQGIVADISTVQEGLSEMERRIASPNYHSDYVPEAQKLRGRLVELRVDLEAMHEVARSYGVPAPA